MNTHKNQDKGFTLVELLIVIVILGILATVTVFAVRGITTQGKTTACAADKKTIEVAAESYMAQKGTYPTGLDVLVTEGLLKDVSVGNWDYAAPVAPSKDYTLTATPAGPCV
jgi:prepilin-type N-terminal cleavage/methylation domain-containing protein